jgi:hypothetical protein
MRLKVENGMVAYVMRAGTDLVRDDMSLAAAERICAKGTKVSKTVKGFPICVDDKFYFEGIAEKSSKSE